jgi:hypothetical protein
MAISIVSRVALSHALSRLLPSLDRRESSLNDEADYACAMDMAAEPGLALGVRLFWATLLAVLLIVVLPIMLGSALRPPSDVAPGTITHLIISTGRVAEPAQSITSRALPRAQPPPRELLPNNSVGLYGR